MLAENLERQLDELAAMQAMYEVELQTDDNEVERLRSAASAPDSVRDEDESELPELQFDVAVPLAEACSTTSPSCKLRVAMPHSYPGGEGILRCSCSAPGASRKLDEQLNDALIQFLEENGSGSEAVMAAAMWLSEAAAAMLAEAQEAAATAAQQPADSADDVTWVRCCLWAEKLLEGRTHKPAAKTLAIANASDLTGLFFYGRPGIIIVEGRQRDIDELVREARRVAGKTLRPKKTQALAEGAASRHYTGLSTRSAMPGDGLDVETLQAELEALGLTHKYRFIIGLEDAK